MAYCSICKAEGKKVPAVMFCANCGKPICAAHVVHGRYCSEECYREHQLKELDKVKPIAHASRPSYWLWAAGVAIFLLAFAITYLLLPYLGV